MKKIPYENETFEIIDKGISTTSSGMDFMQMLLTEAGIIFITVFLVIKFVILYIGSKKKNYILKSILIILLGSLFFIIINSQNHKQETKLKKNINDISKKIVD